MNKFLKFFIYAIVGVLQLTLMPILQIKGLTANIVFLGVIIFAIIDLEDDAFYLAVIGGLILDLVSPVFFGFYTTTLVVFFLLIKYLVQKVLPEINFLLIFAATFILAIIFGFLENLALMRWLNLSILIYASYSACLGLIFFLYLQRKITRNQVIKL